ncbi:gas vesicle protein GvpJ [Amycolatopsis sp.]|uniref:gas vesicle protein GvpJ n=1 Tax=Amycolatopsis sp. TaxID=37632 RepID=UPI002D7F95C6|nr:gas vesicle protein GvpJ [Amycolatopsis sp.]HET6704150.1 gas vesicle protein GvpJ [Amycolatopsis sp.]
MADAGPRPPGPAVVGGGSLAGAGAPVAAVVGGGSPAGAGAVAIDDLLAGTGAPSRTGRGDLLAEVFTPSGTNAAEAVVDLLDRVVHRGAVVTGDVIISLAGIDLVRLDLRLLLLGIEGTAE